MADQDFQSSSFIPEETDSRSSSGGSNRGGNLLTAIAGILTGVVGLAAAGVFLYKQYSQSQLAQKKQQLKQAKANFDQELIDELERLSNRIDTAKKLLDKHVVYTPIFNTVEEATLAGVQFTSMEVNRSDQSQNNQAGSNSGVTVLMQGVGRSYAAVALQSEALAEHEDIVNPILSEFSSVDGGNVRFSVEFSVPKSKVQYDNTI